jgi:hypothetical protein
MKVTLSTSEVEVAEYVGQKRQEINEEKKLVDRKQDQTKDSTEIHIEGIAGEWAFCKIMNVYPDLEFEKRSKYDCYALGFTWDVKTSESADWLDIRFSKASQGKRCDMYVLVVGKRPNYEIVGWIEADAIFQVENVADVGNGRFYRVPRERLKDFKTTGA